MKIYNRQKNIFQIQLLYKKKNIKKQSERQIQIKMHSIQYSPYNMNNEMNTNDKYTSSCKRYGINKYIKQDDAKQIKNKLFDSNQYRDSINQDKIYSYQNKSKQRQSIFNNRKVNDIIKIQDKDSVIEDDYIPSKYYNNNKNDKLNKNDKSTIYDKSVDQSYSYRPNYSQYRKRSKSIKQTIQHDKKQTNKNHKKPHKYKKVRSKSTNQINKTNKTNKKSNLNNQYQQQLQMYKKLCMTLRKQNQQLQHQISKKSKQSSKFNSQIQSLKSKISKMYDYCIQNNKSSKNVDFALKQLIIKHKSKNQKENTKENIYITKINQKQNIMKQSNKLLVDIQLKRLNKSAQLKTKRNKTGIICKNDKNHQTIDTTRTSKKSLNTSNLKQNKLFKKQPKNVHQINDIQSLKTSFNLNNRNITSSKSQQQQQKNLQYDEPVDNQIQQIKQKDEYKQFFQTFVKSLQIFQNNENKDKLKLLKQGGYQIQWAKKSWLDIVQYLIKKGYTNTQNKKGYKKQDSTHKFIR